MRVPKDKALGKDAGLGLLELDGARMVLGSDESGTSFVVPHSKTLR
jgi:hypothetical protein